MVPTAVLIAVINCSIFRLQAADGESKGCPCPTATEPSWDARGPAGDSIDDEPGGLPRFLLVLA